METVFRIFDGIILEGPTFIFSVLLSHLRAQQHALLTLHEFHSIVSHLKQVEARTFDGDTLLTGAYKEWKDVNVNVIQGIRERKVKIVHDQVHELESLKKMQYQLDLMRSVPGISHYAVQFLQFIHRETKSSRREVTLFLGIMCHGLVWLAKHMKNNTIQPAP